MNTAKPLFIRFLLGVVGVVGLLAVISLIGMQVNMIDSLAAAKMLLIVNIVCTLLMTGIIWMVQLVNYPLFNLIGKAQFLHYHKRHIWRTTGVVALPMF